jgi:hypothetical protein
VNLPTTKGELVALREVFVKNIDAIDRVLGLIEPADPPAPAERRQAAPPAGTYVAPPSLVAPPQVVDEATLDVAVAEALRLMPREFDHRDVVAVVSPRVDDVNLFALILRVKHRLERQAKAGDLAVALMGRGRRPTRYRATLAPAADACNSNSTEDGDGRGNETGNDSRVCRREDGSDTGDGEPRHVSQCTRGVRGSAGRGRGVLGGGPQEARRPVEDADAGGVNPDRCGRRQSGGQPHLTVEKPKRVRAEDLLKIVTGVVGSIAGPFERQVVLDRMAKDGSWPGASSDAYRYQLVSEALAKLTHTGTLHIARLAKRGQPTLFQNPAVPWTPPPQVPVVALAGKAAKGLPDEAQLAALTAERQEKKARTGRGVNRQRQSLEVQLALKHRDERLAREAAEGSQPPAPRVVTETRPRPRSRDPEDIGPINPRRIGAGAVLPVEPPTPKDIAADPLSGTRFVRDNRSESAA